jgi:replication factor C small subunit
MQGVKIKKIQKVGRGNVVNLCVHKNHTFIHENGIATHNCDRLTYGQQKSLLSIIEDNSDRVRWILTCNYINKLDPALRSRMEAGYLQMDEMNEEGILNYIIDIIEKEEIVINEDNDLLSHISAYGSDIRRILNSIEGHIDEDNVLHPLSSSSKSNDMSEFESIFIGGEAKDKLAQLLELTEYCDQNTFEYFYQVMYENTHNFTEVSDAVIILAEYLDKASRSANQRLTLDACLYRLFMEDNDE